MSMSMHEHFNQKRELLLWLLLKTHLTIIRKTRTRERERIIEAYFNGLMYLSMMFSIRLKCLNKTNYTIWTLIERTKERSTIDHKWEKRREEVKTNDQLRHSFRLNKKKDKVRWNRHVILRIFDRPSSITRINETLSMR